VTIDRCAAHGAWFDESELQCRAPSRQRSQGRVGAWLKQLFSSPRLDGTGSEVASIGGHASRTRSIVVYQLLAAAHEFESRAQPPNGEAEVVILEIVGLELPHHALDSLWHRRQSIEVRLPHSVSLHEVPDHGVVVAFLVGGSVAAGASVRRSGSSLQPRRARSRTG